MKGQKSKTKVRGSFRDRRNQYRVRGKTAYLTIVRKGGEKDTIRFDAHRVDEVQARLWRICSGRCDGKQIATGSSNYDDFKPLSHLIAGIPTNGQIVFYVDGDYRNCRESNLRHGSRTVAILHHIKRKEALASSDKKAA